VSATAWAARMPLTAAPTAAALRLHPDVQILADHDFLWLRGAEMTEALDASLKNLLIDRRYSVDEQDMLIPIGSRLPEGTLPSGPWIAIGDFFVAKAQPSTAISAAPSIHLQVVRSNEEQPAAVLLTTLDAWIAFATTAPAIRLKSLRIAVSEDNRVIVRGQPVPSIPGERFAEHKGVAVRCGSHWSPAVDASIVRALFHSTPDDLIVLHADGTAEHIHADEFAAASRSGARLMQEAR
jgi:hypothetical protein